MITPLGTIDTLGRRAGVDFVITELRTLFAKNINTGLLLLEAFSAMFAAITVISCSLAISVWGPFRPLR